MKEVLTILAPVLTIVVGFIGAWLLHLRETRKLRGEQADRAQSAAQQQIQTALEERGLERKVEKFNDKLEERDRLFRDLERRFDDLRAMLPEHYVRREDWVEAQARTERKLDAINSQVHDIAVKLN
ncbi:MAG: hypothetical protein AAGI52_06560 [Bacteroidota bacterium]